jgi:hypothetical protein
LTYIHCIINHYNFAPSVAHPWEDPFPTADLATYEAISNSISGSLENCMLRQKCTQVVPKLETEAESTTRMDY